MRRREREGGESVWHGEREEERREREGRWMKYTNIQWVI